MDDVLVIEGHVVTFREHANMWECKDLDLTHENRGKLREKIAAYKKNLLKIKDPQKHPLVLIGGRWSGGSGVTVYPTSIVPSGNENGGSTLWCKDGKGSRSKEELKFLALETDAIKVAVSRKKEISKEIYALQEEDKNLFKGFTPVTWDELKEFTNGK